MAIAAGDFSQRMTDIEPTTTEVGRLKTAINTMLGRVDCAHLAARLVGAADAPLHRRRQPRAAHAAGHRARLRRALPHGRHLGRRGRRPGDGPHREGGDADGRPRRGPARPGAPRRAPRRRHRPGRPAADRTGCRPRRARDLAAAPGHGVRHDDRRAAAAERSAARGEPTRRRRAPARRPAHVGDRARGRRRALAPAAQAPTGPRCAGNGAGRSCRPSPRSHRPPSAGGTPPIVLGDENRIRQVVANLLGNARRFTADDSPIDLRVGVDAAAGMGWIEVADHGEGIPEQIREKIFQRFWRADTSRARETGGTGLGLSIVASIVEALHGAVTVSDTPGGGATFRVAIPLAPERDAAEHLMIETQPLERLEPPSTDRRLLPTRSRVGDGLTASASGRRRAAGPRSYRGNSHPPNKEPTWPSSPSTATPSSPPPPPCAARSTGCRPRRRRCSPSSPSCRRPGPAAHRSRSRPSSISGARRSARSRTALAGINTALAAAGRQYADAEQATTSLFR